MENKNKDKVIIGLVIVIVMLFANNISKNKADDLSPSKFGLLDTDDEIIIDESNKISENNGEDIIDMKVHISGEIKNPGVYSINDGDRLDDLIKRAGGFTETANESSLNLALRLSDQMKIYIPSIYEDTKEVEESLALISNPMTSVDNDKININTASKEELMSLPNIGDKRAQAIIDYRQENLFKDIEDIKNVTGIGDKYYQAMKDLITV